MRLVSLTAENFKRLKSVFIEIGSGVTRFVGENGAGKTSALDAIAAALGGAAATPDMPIRAGETKAVVLLDLEEYTVEKVFTDKGAAIKLTAKDGARIPGGPQGILEKLYGDLTFDPIAFTRLKSSEQAKMLAKVAGVDLASFKARREGEADRRAISNSKVKDLTARLAAMPKVDAPDEEVDIKALADKLDQIGKMQGDYKLEEQRLQGFRQLRDQAVRSVETAKKALADAESWYEKKQTEFDQAVDSFKSTPIAADPSPIRKDLGEAQDVNRKVQAKKDRAKLVAELEGWTNKFNTYDRGVKDIDAEKDKAIAAAPLPIKGLSITEDGIFCNSIPFSELSTSEQLSIAVNIGISLNKNLKLILVRDGSLLDNKSMVALEKLAIDTGSQIIVERVQTGTESGVIIEDGEVKQNDPKPNSHPLDFKFSEEDKSDTPKSSPEPTA